MPTSMFQGLREERASLDKERVSLIAAAEAATSNGSQKGFTDEQREKLATLKDRLTAIDGDLEFETAARDERRTGAGIEDNGEDAGIVDAPKPFASLGEQLAAVAKAALHPHAAVDPRLGKINAAAAGANELVGSEGGFLVQSDFQADLLTLVHDTGLLAGKAKRRSIGANANGAKFNVIDESSRANGSRYGGVRAYWTAEAGQMTATKPKYHQEELTLQKLTGLYIATDEELADVTALESFSTAAFAEEFGFKIDDAMVRGTGAGMPLGVLNAPSLVTVSKETGQIAATFIAENAYKMFARLWAPSLPNATWYINQALYPQLFQLVQVIGTGGVPLFIPPGGIGASPFGNLLGRPVQPIEQASAPGDVGDIFLADYGQYVLIEKGGIQSASSIHVYFDTDQTAFRWTLRTNGRPWRKTALTPFKGADTLSSFVALQAR